MKQLDPKSVWLFYFGSLVGTLFLGISIFYLSAVILKDISVTEIGQALQFPGVFIFFLNYWWILLVIWAIWGYIWALLTFHFYRYELREDGFRKEHGVIWKKYVTIPYERIQNVDIYRGLLARILGLSDLNIQTAGMSSTVGSYGGASEGRLPGLSLQVAEQLRDELIRRARHGEIKMNQGL
jgi:uncharacterized protein